MKRLFAFDLDGTILDEKKHLSDKTYQTIKKLKEEGNIITYASGRNIPNIYDALKEREIIGDYFIASNGTVIYDINKKEILFTSYMDEDFILYLKNCDFCENMRVLYPLNDLDIKRNPNLSVKNITKVNFFVKDQNSIDKIISDLETNFPNYTFSKTWYTIDLIYGIEIAPNNLNKFKGIKYICNLLNFPIENTVAFGDTGIDMEMLKNCGIGVAMQNADQNIKDCAKYVCKSNNEDGVANWIEENILKKED